MLPDIRQHIAIIDNSIKWAKDYGKESFPFDAFKDYRRKLKRIASALEENCSAAAYGESQVGKSYLISSLLSSPNSPFVITNAGKDYSFIDELNPSGGKNSKVESTGVITRFTLRKGENKMDDFVKVRNLSIVDIILLLADSYYNDIKLNPDSVLKYDDINKELANKRLLWESHTVQQNIIDEDDIKDIADYMHNVIGNAAAGVNQSSFAKIIAPVIKYVSYDKWVDVFGILWNNNAEFNRLFSILINEYKKINFEIDIFVPFDAVLAEKGTLLKIDWLDTVCGVHVDTGRDEIYTSVYDKNGSLLASDFHKGNLSALIAELTFELPVSLAEDRPFLNKLDLLDFPGARSREKYKESDIKTVLPKILRRGKVAYLFNKYSRSLKISSVLFCHHNDQKAEATIGETINSWIEENIGATPEERTNMLSDTNGIAPLFFIATKFNIDLERIKTDSESNVDKLDNHWGRFNTVIPEIIKPNKWLDNWVKPGGLFRSEAFQNVYPLRDFYWSGKNRVFDGYSDGETKSEEKCVHTYSDYPLYFDNLKASFLRNDFVRKHFADPEQTWNDVATINNDGSKAIIRNLSTISNVLDGARKKKFMQELLRVKQEMYKSLSVFFEPADQEAKNRKVQKISRDIKMALTFSVGKNPGTFGHIIDELMIPAGDLRNIAYDIIICHTDIPTDFSVENFIRKQANISPEDGKQEVIDKLCNYFMCKPEELEEAINNNGGSLDNIISVESETLTTVASIVTKHIIDYWNAYVNSKVKVLEPMLPHSDDVVFMLTSLLKKLGIKECISKRIDEYCNIFSLYEQPNAIADYASITLNNFVSTVGRDYISNNDVEVIQKKAEKCKINVDMSPDAWNIERRPQPLLQTLDAFDAATDINAISKEDLMKLPLWDNFYKWQNLVNIGLLYSSEISQIDPIANAKMKDLIDGCEQLYTTKR